MKTKALSPTQIRAVLCLGLIAIPCSSSCQGTGIEWTSNSPRDEICPLFENHNGASLVLRADERPGLNGWWQATLPAEPGLHYQFTARRRATGMTQAEQRRAAVVRLVWLDEQDRPVLRDEPVISSYRTGEIPRAEPEFPLDTAEVDGWTRVEGIYRVPQSATRVNVELHFRWGPPRSQIEWADIHFQRVEQPQPRSVTIAAIHYRPEKGHSSAEKREQFAPLIVNAASRKADLIVLPETLTYYNSGKSFADCAELIPGPSTDYFGRLAKQHRTHIVAGLIERDQHLVYNVAVLLGPNGQIIGKYRKVALPRGEIEGGITPGTEYPVFQTSFGKVGMMVCYDGFFPEVARELTKNGADIIVWPVWGCNPMFAAARACENHVYVASSTYTDAASNWMITGIYGQDGKILSQASQWGTAAIATVDLNKPMYWHSLGDFKAQIDRHRPPVPAE